METNKLLTLEDIEKIETSINQQNYSDDDVFNLAATARAYWELKRLKGMQVIDLDDPNYPDCREITEDKPHAPTIRAVIEALRKENERYMYELLYAISHLESILKDLNN